jgi:uncharacterized membrane protein
MAPSAYVEFFDGAYSNFRIVDIAAVGYQYLMTVVAVVLVAGVCIALQAQWLAARRTKAKAKTRSGSR